MDNVAWLQFRYASPPRQIAIEAAQLIRLTGPRKAALQVEPAKSGTARRWVQDALYR